eukprot:3366867-Amphidinium_carterae.1
MNARVGPTKHLGAGHWQRTLDSIKWNFSCPVEASAVAVELMAALVFCPAQTATAAQLLV